MLTSLAVVLTGVYLIIVSQEHVTSTLTLIFGLVIGILALADLVFPYIRRP